MKHLILVLLATCALNANAHSILPLPADELVEVNLDYSLSVMENFFLTRNVSAQNLDCAEYAWNTASSMAESYAEANNGQSMSGDQIYGLTDYFYDLCTSGNKGQAFFIGGAVFVLIP